MSKILSVQQIRNLDEYTIKNEPIKSIDLMERASMAFCDWYIERYSPHKKIGIVCGVGNNGGDGLAIGRILKFRNYTVRLFAVGDLNKCSEDFNINFNRLEKGEVVLVNSLESMGALERVDIVIDAMFGSGLSRSLGGLFAEIALHINNLKKNVISVDIASGLFADESNNESDVIIEPTHTVAFQVPKMSFLFPQNHLNVGEWHLVDIGLSQNYIDELESSSYFLEKADILRLMKRRSKYDHKGSNGRGMIISGSHGKMGAAVLAARGALRSGIGLLTMVIPEIGYQILQTAVPEAMTITDVDKDHITSVPPLDNFDALGAGPGIGRSPETAAAIAELIRVYREPLVLDADALNIISAHHELLEVLPMNSILTPHPKEFERLAGTWTNDYQRLELQREFSRKYNLIIVLKGAHTSISNPDGEVYFNSTGNPGMATAGSGDVLLGIITSFLAQGYAPMDAAILGVYIHGLAGDLASSEVGEHALIASDIIQGLAKAIKSSLR